MTAWSRALLGIGVALSLAVTGLTALGASRWVGTTFPGFLVLPNGVIASAGILDWPATKAGGLFQRRVLAADGESSETRDGIYRRISGHPGGTSFVYDVAGDERTARVDVASRTFTTGDARFLFGAYLASALPNLLVGFLGLALCRDGSRGLAVLLVGTTGGIYELTAVGLYDPDASFRLHALTEALYPAALLHLAGVLHPDRGTPGKRLIRMGCWLAPAVAIPYQIFLYAPDRYSAVHSLAEGYLGLAGVALSVSLLTAHVKGARLDTIQQSALVGTLLGVGVPAVIMGMSAASGGIVPVNYAALATPLFPLCLGFGVIRTWSAGLHPAAEAGAEPA